MAEFTHVTFVMPVLNEEKFLRSSVESVLRQETNGEKELILGLGPSTDSTTQIAELLCLEHSEIKIVHVGVANTSIALNECIREARHDVVVRVDAHSELYPGYTALALRLLNSTGAANVGGRMVAEGSSAFERAVAFAYNSRFGLGGGAHHTGLTPGPRNTVYLGVFDKTKLSKVGGFDERWVRGQDWELNLRLRTEGFLVFFHPNLRVTYHPRGNLSALARQFVTTGYWRGKLTRTYPSETSFRYWIPPLLVLSFLLFFPLLCYSILLLALAFGTSRLAFHARLWVLAVLPTIHICWGIGFWLGTLKSRS